MPFYRFGGTEFSDAAGGDDVDPEEVPRAVAGFGGEMVTKGLELEMHAHRKAQLILTLRGVVRCEADQGVWIVPPRCAVWIPGNAPHSVTMAGNVEVYCLFVEPEAALALPRQCCTLSVSPLLEQLLLHVTRMPVLYDEKGDDGRIASVLLDQLAAAPIEKLNFPMPVDGKLRKIAAAMMADPSDRGDDRRLGAPHGCRAAHPDARAKARDWHELRPLASATPYPDRTAAPRRGVVGSGRGARSRLRGGERLCHHVPQSPWQAASPISSRTAHLCLIAIGPVTVDRKSQ